MYVRICMLSYVQMYVFTFVSANVNMYICTYSIHMFTYFMDTYEHAYMRLRVLSYRLVHNCCL